MDKKEEGSHVPRGVFAIFRNILRQRNGIWRLLNSVSLDFRYGGKFLGGDIYSEDDEKYSHIMNSDYRVIDHLFSKVTIGNDDVITDVGCGKGRVFNYLLSKQVKNPLFGIELSSAVAEFTRARLKRYPQIKVLQENVDLIQEIPGTIFYLFNPFGTETMRNFSKILERQWSQNSAGKQIQILYFNPKRISVFQENPFWEVSERIDTKAVGYQCGAFLVRSRKK